MQPSCALTGPFLSAVRMLQRDQRASVPLVFLLLSLCFLSVRVAWLTLHGFEMGSDTCHKSVTFVLTRVAFVFYFGALTLLLFYWAQQYHRTVLDDAVFAFLPSVRWWFIGCVLAADGVCVCACLNACASHWPSESTPPWHCISSSLLCCGSLWAKPRKAVCFTTPTSSLTLV